MAYVFIGPSCPALTGWVAGQLPSLLAATEPVLVAVDGAADGAAEAAGPVDGRAELLGSGRSGEADGAADGALLATGEAAAAVEADAEGDGEVLVSAALVVAVAVSESPQATNIVTSSRVTRPRLTKTRAGIPVDPTLAS